MKKRAAILCACMLLSGCSGNSSPTESTVPAPKNLDTSDTAVTLYTPDSGQWHIMEFPISAMSRDSLAVLQAAANAYCGAAVDPADVVCRIDPRTAESIRDNIDIAPYDTPYNALTDAELADLCYLRCVSDDLYFEINPFHKIECCDLERLGAVLGVKLTNAWSWRPSFTGSSGGVIYPDQTDKTDTAYTLDGAPVTVRQAADFMSAFLNEAKPVHITSALCEYEYAGAEVYTFDGGQQGIYLEFTLKTDGVPIDGNNHSVNLEGYHIVANRIKCFTCTGHSADWLWTCVMNQDAPSSDTPCELRLSYDDALQRLSETLSQETVFHVKDAALFYCMEEITDGSARWGLTGQRLAPMYQFTLDKINSPEYRVLCANVNAVTGEVSLRRG